jgi:hypothetical protein
MDFDGTLNTYASGYTSPPVDPPVKGALEWMQEIAPVFQLVIFSARANDNQGVEDIQSWLNNNGFQGIPVTITDEKPANAQWILDDRGLNFSGQYPSVEELKDFRPWWDTGPQPALPPVDGHDAASLAASVAARAAYAEGDVTDVLRRACEMEDGLLVSLENRQKTLVAIEGKIENVADEHGWDLVRAAVDIKDSLRYTVVLDLDDYVRASGAVIDRVEAAGPVALRTRNYWLPGANPRYADGTYVGINVVFLGLDGFPFEVQFHTPQSLDVQAINWQLYRELRSRTLTPEQAEPLQETMRLNNGWVPNPYTVTAAARGPILKKGGKAHPMGKAGLEWAGYHGPVTGTKRCGTCSYFAAGQHNQCGMFDTAVESDYTCREWSHGLNPTKDDPMPYLERQWFLAAYPSGWLEPETARRVNEWAAEGRGTTVEEEKRAWVERVYNQATLTAAPIPQATGEAIPIETHNDLLVAGYKRADELVPKLASILEPILRQAGNEAARQFAIHATDHLTAAGEATWSAPAPDELVDVDSLIEKLHTKTDPIRQAVVAAAMTPGLKAAGLDFDVTHPLTQKVLAQSGSQITNIAETTQLNVMRIINKSVDQGLSIPDTATAIRQGMSAASPQRATLIARTEIVGAVNGGSLAMIQQVDSSTGQSHSKTWLTAPGAPHPRHETYEGLDGQTVALDDYFQVGDSQLQFPGDPDGDIGEVANCRCTMIYGDGQEVDAESGGPSTSGIDTSAPGEPGVTEAMTPPVGDDISVPVAPFVNPEFVTEIRDKGLDRPLSEIKPTTATGRRVFPDSAPTTEHQFFNTQTGEWDAARKPVQQDAIGAHFAGKTPPPPGSERHAYFTAGGGASGKGSLKFELDGKDVGVSRPRDDTTSPYGTYLEEKPDWIVIDPDRIKAMLPEYKELTQADDFYAASGVHEESSYLAKEVTRIAQEKGYNVVLDTTGQGEKFVGKMRAAHDLGYDVKVSMSSAPTNAAIDRAMVRGNKTGRFVSVPPLKDAHSGASVALKIWKDETWISDARVFDTTGKVEEVFRRQGDGAAQVLNRDKYEKIVAKADEGKLAPPERPAFAPVPEVSAPRPVTKFKTTETDPYRASLKQEIASTSNRISGLNTRRKLLHMAPGEQDRLDANKRFLADLRRYRDESATIDTERADLERIARVLDANAMPGGGISTSEERKQYRLLVERRLGQLDALTVSAEPAPVAPVVTSNLKADIDAIRARGEWLSKQDAVRRAAEITNTGFHDRYYPRTGGIPEYQQELMQLVLEAGSRLDQEIHMDQSVLADYRAAHDEATALAERESPELLELRAQAGRLYSNISTVKADLRNSMAARQGYPGFFDVPYDKRQEIEAAVIKSDQYQAAYNAYEEAHRQVDELYRAYRQTRADADTKVKELGNKLWTPIREQTMAALTQLREMGPVGEGARVRYAKSPYASKEFTGYKKAQGLLDRAQPYYPTDWLQRTRTIAAGTARRGYHRSLGLANAEIRVSDYKKGMITADPPGMSTAIHELGHEMEESIPFVRDLEEAFYEWRTRGGSFTAPQEPNQKLSLLNPNKGYGRSEIARPDKFSEAYMGKWYSGTNYELLTMGLEAIWNGAYVLDEEYRQWVLGMLALL